MKNLNTKKLNRRLKGYHKFFRGRFLLLQNKVLTFQEYVLWDISLTTLADWDSSPEHKDIYGSFEYSQQEIAYFLGCDSSSISRYSKKLFNLGFWVKRPDGRIGVVGIELLDSSAKLTTAFGIVDFQEYIVNPHLYYAVMNTSHEELHQKFPKEKGHTPPQSNANLHAPHSKSLISSKGESTFNSTNDIDTNYDYRCVTTPEEAEKIFSDYVDNFVEEGGEEL